jgi:Glycosyltransferase family 87
MARASDLVFGRMADLPAAARVDVPTRRRVGVFRRAIRHETSRIHDPRRLLMMVILGCVGGLVLAGLLARGEAAGADTRAYWAAGRLWLNGGDPYHPAGPFMPYVYSPWMLPLFVPWSVLPWDVAWFFWRGATVIALLWSVHWAYSRRPMTTAILLVLLAFPIAANLDTGNINLPLTLLLFGAQFSRPAITGLLWMVAVTVKWVPAAFFPFLSPRGRLWGLGWLALALVLTALTLPQTLVQLEVLFSFQRPFRIDYAVFVWALVPWAWRNPQAFRWLMPSTWPGAARAGTAAARLWRSHLRRSPARTSDTLRRVMRARFRAFLGLEV